MPARGPAAGAPLHTVLFDLDGTFADTLPALARALNAALGERDLPAVEPDSLRPVVSLGTRAIVAHGLGGTQPGELASAVCERFLAHYAASSARGARHFPGIAVVLAGLARRGLAWGIVTNKLERFARPLIEQLDPHRECVCLIGGDSALHPKPHPAPLLLACRQAAIAPHQTVYVGDAPGDVLAGRRAGMRTVAAAYGYLPGGATPTTWGASAVIDTPGELLGWIDAGADEAR